MIYAFARGVVWILMQLLLRFFGGFRIEGAENVPRSGAVILSPNHVSDSDPPIVGFAARRWTWFMAKEELFAMKGLGKIITLLRAFPVKRGAPDRNALRKAENLLKDGEAVVIFPEGMLTITGFLGELNPGIVMIAMRSGAPVVPIGLNGTDDLMPYGKTKPRKMQGPIVVRIGKPIPIEELTGGLKGREGLDNGVRVLTEAMNSLVDEKYRSRPEGAPNANEP